MPDNQEHPQHYYDAIAASAWYEADGDTGLSAQYEQVARSYERSLEQQENSNEIPR